MRRALDRFRPSQAKPKQTFRLPKQGVTGWESLSPSHQARRPVHGPDHIIPLLPSFFDYGCCQHPRCGRLRRASPEQGGRSRPHMLSAPRAGLQRGCRGSPDWAPSLNPGARCCGGGGVGAGRRHVQAAAAREGSISSAAGSRAP